MNLRLLDLALSYALDNPAIHMNDTDKIAELRRMHAWVLARAVASDTTLSERLLAKLTSDLVNDED